MPEHDPSLDAVMRTDRFVDALASGARMSPVDPLSAMLGGWRDDVRSRPDTQVVTLVQASAALAKTQKPPRRNRFGLTAIGAAAAAVLCIGGFGAVVYDAGPGDALYGRGQRLHPPGAIDSVASLSPPSASSVLATNTAVVRSAVTFTSRPAHVQDAVHAEHQRDRRRPARSTCTRISPISGSDPPGTPATPVAVRMHSTSTTSCWPSDQVHPERLRQKQHRHRLEQCRAVVVHRRRSGSTNRDTRGGTPSSSSAHFIAVGKRRRSTNSC